ncbi:MAG TPA: ATP-binding protein [Epulopiscium sp.]|nr:ATP-binding protein [Candidatus Epulonipiscium sp.]
MISKKQQYKQLIRIYDTKRLESTKEQARRQEHIHATIPRIAQIDDKMSLIGIKLAKTAFDPNANTSELIVEFQEENQALLKEKQELLISNNYPADYLELQFDCNKCNDTGYLGTEQCTCLHQSLINVAYEQSNLKHILEYENFDTFDFEYYAKEVDKKFGRSPHENMQNLYRFCVHFVHNFNSSFQNILFHGNTGLGKTFLCNCIAKDLLDQGKTVLYLPAVQLFQLFETARFHREDMEEFSKEMLDTLLTVELLIIDDLGTEFITSFTGPELFNTINTRVLNRKATMISTNLSLEELKEQYSDRIVSRILGSYEVLPVFGQDIRIIKKYRT